MESVRLEPVLGSKRSHRRETPAHWTREQPPLAQLEKAQGSNKDPPQSQINFFFFLKKQSADRQSRMGYLPTSEIR